MAEVIIVGAGPYGLSIAAHLRSLGVSHRVFGLPMYNWRAKMPKGMLLKSDPYASNLSDPGSTLRLRDFYKGRGIPYSDEAIRVSRETFIEYGEEFQRRLVPELEERLVVNLDRTADGFAVTLDDGEITEARHVILAIGISDFPYIPPALSGLSSELVSHPAAHQDLAVFRGRDIIVVGAGSSAIDTAALAHEGGASVRLVARREELRFHDRAVYGVTRSLMERVSAPNTGVGPGWRNIFFTETPQLFRYLPPQLRRSQVENTHGPAGGWFMQDRVVGKVQMMLGVAPQGVEAHGGQVHLRVAGPDGAQQTLAADHIIAATGYKVDLAVVPFLAEPLRRQIALVGTAPELSSHFETSVPGLYVAGPAAAFAFGPVCRFVLGTEFTAPRIARHLAASAARRTIVPGAAIAARR